MPLQRLCLLSVLVFVTFLDSPIDAQQTTEQPEGPTKTSGESPAEQKPVELPEIADEPASIDPATLVNSKLAEKVTVVFREAALSEVGEWIENNAGIPVLIDRKALELENISLSEPVTDQLADEPLYLLLNRLSVIDVAWYVQGSILRITSQQEAEERKVTIPYSVSKLLDAGYEVERLTDVILNCIEGPWYDLDGEGGSVDFLGDVLFAMQNHERHLELRGLLKALEKHSRRTFILAPPEHEALRSKLQQNVSVDFDDSPLIEALNDLAQQTRIAIRLDYRALAKYRIRLRQPVSIRLAERKLQTVLDVMLAQLKLTWILKDGVLLVTSTDYAEQRQLTAVYDVRDLCRSFDESEGLANAIMRQSDSMWEDVDGEGGAIQFPLAGVMVVRQTGRIHERLLSLLEAYRGALASSKQRKRHDPDEDVLTRYYRMQSDVANVELMQFLVKTVAPDSWRIANEKAVGEIRGILPAGKRSIGGNVKAGIASSNVDHSVLVIVQKRRVHLEIEDILGRIQNGDASLKSGLGGGGLGGGGFGGGFFSLPQSSSSPAKR
ncbi:MAG: hypothetical protein NXI04_05630 [Planctomycetaceae bacterium]|nr:hypothetical protein [Planctomycetaceae bacterium]